MSFDKTKAGLGPQVFETFDEALRIQRLPLENYAIMHRIVDHIPIARFEASSGFVRGVRRDGGHDLLFKAGYTTGFQSKEEGEEAAGVECYSNSKTGVNWMVWHPKNGSRDGNSVSSARRDRPQRQCPICGNILPGTGLCDFCG